MNISLFGNGLAMVDPFSSESRALGGLIHSIRDPSDPRLRVPTGGKEKLSPAFRDQ